MDKHMFPTIYNNFITGLYEKDYKYLKQICEPNFYNKLEETLKSFTSPLHITTTDVEDERIDTNILFIKEELHVGISTNREENKKEATELVDKSTMPNTNIIKRMEKLLGSFKSEASFYVSNHFRFRFVLRRVVDLKSNLIISKLPVSDFTENEVHSIILEEEFGSYSTFIGGDEARDIRIADLDNIMRGNPLV
jgi:hypothetical protein